MSRRTLLSVLALFLLSTQYSVLNTAHAHPVPQSHDRTIVVKLTAEAVVVSTASKWMSGLPSTTSSLSSNAKTS
jgi:hypothetical protein